MRRLGRRTLMITHNERLSSPPGARGRASKLAYFIFLGGNLEHAFVTSVVGCAV
jgi:hypothetical protein